MEIGEEEFGGTIVILQKGDSLRSVPRSHKRLVTRGIEAWWSDPTAAFAKVSSRAVTPKMSEWFRRMADSGEWRLQLHKASPDSTAAGYWLSSPGIRGAEVEPPHEKRAVKDAPPQLLKYYKLVGYVDWMGFGASGGIDGPQPHLSLSVYDFDYKGAKVDLARTYIFGHGPAGDMLIYTADGRGGWLCHENGKIHILGTVLDTIDWVYGELLADRCPDFDYSW